MSDKPHEMAVRSPWTEGAWIMAFAAVPNGWQVRWKAEDEWRTTSYLDADSIVEARPSGGESS